MRCALLVQECRLGEGPPKQSVGGGRWEEQAIITSVCFSPLPFDYPTSIRIYSISHIPYFISIQTILQSEPGLGLGLGFDLFSVPV